MRGVRKLRGRLSWTTGLLGLAGVFGLALLIWPESSASAADTAAADAAAIVRSVAGRHRKAMAIDDLYALDTAASRLAVVDLADDGDDATALAAIAVLCRGDWQGARGHLQQIVADDERSDVVRSAALVALVDRTNGDGDHWSDISTFVTANTRSGGAVRAAARAAGHKHWPTEVSDE